MVPTREPDLIIEGSFYFWWEEMIQVHHYDKEFEGSKDAFRIVIKDNEWSYFYTDDDEDRIRAYNHHHWFTDNWPEIERSYTTYLIEKELLK